MKRGDDRGLPGWLTGLVVAGAAVTIFIAERRRPLRGRRESSLIRTTRNAALAGMSAAMVEALQVPVLVPVRRFADRHSMGIVPRLGLSPLASTIASILILDWTLWVWHWLNHRNEFFWRFHKAHHIDRDLDASTALRFHFGEMGLSVFHRAAQILITGPSEMALGLWQTMLLVSILFHHSNLDLGESADRKLSLLLVTPRMHGIHHSDYQRETDSNWSSLFSFWDRFVGTFRDDIPQDLVRPGVAAYQSPSDVTFQRTVLVPLDDREDWIDEAGHERIERVVG